MSKFYVGQRVRLARPRKPENFGRTGFIREFMPERKSRTATVNCLCDWDDGIRDGWTWEGFSGNATHTDQLEPLQPERNQTIAWSECVWKPEHMRAAA